MKSAQEIMLRNATNEIGKGDALSTLLRAARDFDFLDAVAIWPRFAGGATNLRHGDER
jgi:hypothetical protein